MKKVCCFIVMAILCCNLLASDSFAQSKEQLKKWLKRFPDADKNKDGVLTREEAAAFRKQKSSARNPAARSAVKKTHENVKYGEHKRNVIDLWLAKSDKPTPLLICIHGGGFRGGDKASYSRSPLIPNMLENGISVAAINYRLTEEGKNPYPAQMHDSGRAVQFLRYHSEKYNLNKNRFAATGGSAGACILLWLGFHPDLADSKNDDPVLRESTRLQVLAPVNGPTSLHLLDSAKLFEVDSLVEHPALRPLFAIPPEGKIKWTEELTRRARDASALTHLTKDDPPAFMTYPPNVTVTEKSNPNLWVHHPRFGLKLKEAMDKLGIESHIQFQGGSKPKGYRSQADFIIQKLKE